MKRLVQDYFVRRIKFVGDEFFNSVQIRDASRAPYDVEEKIEFPLSFLGPYMGDGDNVNILVEDRTSGRIPSERFSLSLEGKVYFRDCLNTIRITLGTGLDHGMDGKELAKMLCAKEQHCGSYYIEMHIPIPDLLIRI